jgi:hypothetical protein
MHVQPSRSRSHAHAGPRMRRVCSLASDPRTAEAGSVTNGPACAATRAQVAADCAGTLTAPPARSQDGRHAVAYELAWRALEDPSRRASLPVRQQLGDHLKSAVSYALQRDTRELDANGIFDAGSLLKCASLGCMTGSGSPQLVGVLSATLKDTTLVRMRKGLTSTLPSA